jgi:NodT family efflux transporter outer membrane factor (OMF) lipoprotein
MKTVLLTTVVAAAVALSGCASTKPVRKPETALPARFETGALATQPLELDHWWVVYGDTQLRQLVEEALASAPDAKMIEARLRESRATRSGQIFSAYPQGNLVGSASRRNSEITSGGGGFSLPGSTDTYGAEFDVSWELDIFGRTRTARRAVDNNYAATRFNIEASRQSLAANVADSLFAARGLAQQLTDARETQRISRALRDNARLRSDRGLIAEGDASRTNSDVAQADANVLALQAQFQAARRSLLVLLGRGAQPVDSLQITAAEPVLPPVPQAVPGELLQRRPDVRQSEQQLYLAIGQLKIDRLALFPKFTILPGAGITRSTGPSFAVDSSGNFIPSTLSTTTQVWNIGANVNIPVLNRPQLLATARASDAKAEQAVITYEKAVQGAYGEAENLLVQYGADKAGVELLTVGEAEAHKAYDAAKVRYDRGLDDLTTFLSAEQAWRGARTALTNSRTQALRRSVQTFKALGGGWTPINGLPKP